MNSDQTFSEQGERQTADHGEKCAYRAVLIAKFSWQKQSSFFPSLPLGKWIEYIHSTPCWLFPYIFHKIAFSIRSRIVKFSMANGKTIINYINLFIPIICKMENRFLPMWIRESVRERERERTTPHGIRFPYTYWKVTPSPSSPCIRHPWEFGLHAKYYKQKNRNYLKFKWLREFIYILTAAYNCRILPSAILSLCSMLGENIALAA